MRLIVASHGHFNFYILRLARPVFILRFLSTQLWVETNLSESIKAMGPTLDIAVPVAAAAVMNYIIYARVTKGTKHRNILPPGPVIGAIWMALFVLMGYSIYLLRTSGRYTEAVMVAALITWSIMYPVLTRLQSGTRTTRVMNYLTLLAATSVLIAVLVTARTALDKKPAAFLAPVLAWAAYVNLSDVLESN